MTDLAPTILANSDRLTADDLLGGPITVTITRVTSGSSENPIYVYYEGDNGRPWMPCKSMRRVLVAAWDTDGTKYAGRRLTLYRDPDVKYGGIAVGGVRISHMSHIDNDLAIMLTQTRGKKAPYKVRRLAPPEPVQPPPLSTVLESLDSVSTIEKLDAVMGRALRYQWSADDRKSLNDYADRIRKSIEMEPKERES